MKITLTGNPISTGTIYRSTARGIHYMTKRGKDRKEQYMWEAKSQWKGEPLMGELQVDIRLYFETKRKADWDNFHKISMDALQGIVFENDSQIKIARVEKFYDKENPRIEIYLTQLINHD